MQSLGWEDPLEKGKANHSSILTWRIPWTIPWGRQELDMTERLSLSKDFQETGEKQMSIMGASYFMDHIS